MSKFLSLNLRGGNDRLNALCDDEGYIDIDQIMAEYRPDRRYNLTMQMLSEVIQYSEKGRFSAKVVYSPDGQPRIFIKANQGHFGDIEVDLTKSCELITAWNMPSTCLHSTTFRAWQQINGNDDATNGIIPGGLPRARRDAVSAAQLWGAS